MVSAAASRSSRQPGTNTTPSSSRNALPPSKKARLSQSTPKDRPNGFQALLNGKPNKSSPIAAKTNGTKHSRKDRVEEGSAVVGSGIGAHGDIDMADAPKEVIEISSGEEDTDSDDEEVMDTAPSASLKVATVNGTTSQGDQQMEEGTAEPEEMSFGERLQAQEPDVAVPEVIDVEAAFAASNPDATAVAVSSNKKALAPPSASSLGTVLTQALRTNDQDLLDSCLRVVDVDTIYATVERLPSPLVATLLQKLAERLHKRPGRAGLLMIWVQWSLAAHGGFLASQPHLVKQLSTLNRVLKERASGLQPLLSLKGRLDMLHAQLELRSRNQKRTIQDEENEAVIYVEGEDDESSEEEENQIAVKDPKRKSQQYSEDEEDESSGDDMPTTIAYHAEDDSEEGSEDEEEGMFDDEASETDADTGDDMSEPESDDENEREDISGSEEESRRARRSNIGRAGVARRY